MAMSALQAMEAIVELLEGAMEPDAHPMDVHAAIVGAHTHAILQTMFLRRAQVRAELIVYRDVDGRAVH